MQDQSLARDPFGLGHGAHDRLAHHVESRAMETRAERTARLAFVKAALLDTRDTDIHMGHNKAADSKTSDGEVLPLKTLLIWTRTAFIGDWQSVETPQNARRWTSGSGALEGHVSTRLGDQLGEHLAQRWQ